IADNGRATRNRAALGTLANRRSEAEQEHAAAIVGGDRAKIAEARREALDSWRAERRARGDGEAEINAAARALEREYRKTALRHRLAQMDEAGITRALDGDEDAKADPGMAREVAGDIRQIRRDDPARVGEASIERDIAAKKRDGRIDTPEEETAYRYKRRLEAQARRGIPEHQRRLLTNDERTALAADYLRIESSQGKDAADAWLDDQAQWTGLHAERFKAELNAPPAFPEAPAGRLPDREGRVEPAQASPDAAKPPVPPTGQSPGRDSERAAARDALRNKIDAEADTLDRDYDPGQKPGQPSRIKRAFALLKLVDDPAFDELAREFHYDPARLRAVARLLGAKPGDYAALLAGLADENGPINDFAFFTLYAAHARDLIGTGAAPGGRPVPSEDRRISAVLHLLGHDLSSSVRGELARRQDVNSEPFPQIAPDLLAALGITSAAALWLRRGRRTKPDHEASVRGHVAGPFKQTPGGNESARLAAVRSSTLRDSTGPRSVEFFRQSPQQAFQSTRWPPINAQENVRRGLAAADVALEKALRGQAGIVGDAMYRADLGRTGGSITFRWGTPGDPGKGYTGGLGLSHLIAKHGIEHIRPMVETIARGKISPHPKSPGRLLVEHGDQLVVLARDYSKAREIWIITSYSRKKIVRDVPFDLSRLRRPIFFELPSSP
ncbi:MAG: hypothetical protein JNM29_12050, partial [Candidatus Odyssella sp.]|nr:hypothetical protein [Candidatus Odyssella sp.]